MRNRRESNDRAALAKLETVDWVRAGMVGEQSLDLQMASDRTLPGYCDEPMSGGLEEVAIAYGIALRGIAPPIRGLSSNRNENVMQGA